MLTVFSDAIEYAQAHGISMMHISKFLTLEEKNIFERVNKY